MRLPKKCTGLWILICLGMGILTTPLWAAAEPADVDLQINGKILDAASILVENGHAMASAEALAMATGAALQWQDGSNLTLSKNDVTLALTEDSPVMQHNDGAISLFAAPLRKNGVLYVPIRAVCDGLNIQVQWNEPGRQVEVSFDNTRDGMTPEALLLKAEQASRSINIFEISGSNATTMNINGQSLDLDTQMTAFTQIQPFEIYIRQTIDMPDALPDDSAPAQVESYLSESDWEHIYMKQDESGWVKMPMPVDPEIFKQRLQAQADPTAALAQMKQYGVAYAFADDVVRNEQAYYAVNVVIDQQMMKNITDSMAGMFGNASNSVQEMLNQMTADMSYTVLINKATFIQESLEMSMYIQMPIEEQTIQMTMTSQTFVTPRDSFTSPDVSDAVEMPAEPLLVPTSEPSVNAEV
jgi:hypothetical protein